jgi:hypothetical protein
VYIRRPALIRRREGLAQGRYVRNPAGVKIFPFKDKSRQQGHPRGGNTLDRYNPLLLSRLLLSALSILLIEEHNRSSGRSEAKAGLVDIKDRRSRVSFFSNSLA